MPISFNSIIIGSGSYYPENIIKNEDFLNHNFYNTKKEKIAKSNLEITQKFEEITGIRERRYASRNQTTSDIAYLSAQAAVENSGIDPETLDYIIVAHNFGDVKHDNRRSDFVPSLAARVKFHLGIKNPYTVCYDLAFGCPGWLQGVIQSDYILKSGQCKRILICGAETLSRISDPSDIDSMLYSDGAGSIILESRQSEMNTGIISHSVRSDTLEYSKLLWMDKSYDPNHKDKDLYLKMHGHSLYKYALSNVPNLVKESIEKAGLNFTDINKVLIHQANEKMDVEILRRLFNLYDIENVSDTEIFNLMPMTISWLGNNSVATLPIMYDLIMKNKIENHNLKSGDNIVFASVGAGMNINSMIYRVP